MPSGGPDPPRSGYRAAYGVADGFEIRSPRIRRVRHAPAAARQVLEGLRGLPVLAGVRDPAALADLPEPERQAWQAFWQGVEGLLRGPDPAR